MKKRCQKKGIFTFPDNYRTVLTALFILICSTSFGQGGWTKPNNSYGPISNRGSFDSTLFFPTGSGAPSGTASLKGYNLHKSAIYFDSSAKKFWVFSPTDSAWYNVGSGGADSSIYATLYRLYRVRDSLNTSINTKLNITDTSNKWVVSLYRKSGSDSVFFRKGSSSVFAFRDTTLIVISEPSNQIFVGTGSGHTSYSGLTYNDVSKVLAVNGVQLWRGQYSAGDNLGLGTATLQANAGGSYNTAIGDSAGNNTTTGGYNTFLGGLAGNGNTTGHNNTYVGYLNSVTSTGNYNTIIGGPPTGGTTSSSSNLVILSDGQGTVRYYCNASGNTGINTTNPTHTLDVNGLAKVSNLGLWDIGNNSTDDSVLCIDHTTGFLKNKKITGGSSFNPYDTFQLKSTIYDSSLNKLDSFIVLNTSPDGEIWSQSARRNNDGEVWYNTNFLINHNNASIGSNTTEFDRTINYNYKLLDSSPEITPSIENYSVGFKNSLTGVKGFCLGSYNHSWIDSSHEMYLNMYNYFVGNANRAGRGAQYTYQFGKENTADNVTEIWQIGRSNVSDNGANRVTITGITNQVNMSSYGSVDGQNNYVAGGAKYYSVFGHGNTLNGSGINAYIVGDDNHNTSSSAFNYQFGHQNDLTGTGKKIFQSGIENSTSSGNEVYEYGFHNISNGFDKVMLFGRNQTAVNGSSLRIGPQSDCYWNMQGNVADAYNWIATPNPVGIGAGTIPNASAILDITSTTKGLLIPRMTTIQRNAISSPATGLLLDNTSTTHLEHYNGSAYDQILTTADTSTNNVATHSYVTKLPAYSFRANNTNATADATNPTYEDAGQQTYTGTITWTGTTAPSGSTNHSYHWEQIGKQVTLRLNLVYGVAGAAVTQVVCTLPTDCPTPEVPTGLSGNSDLLDVGNVMMTTSLTAYPSSPAQRCMLRINSGSTGYEIIANQTGASYQDVYITLQYFAQ